MKRFTYFDGEKWCLKINDTVYSDFPFIDRLAAYEDTGLTPQEVDEWLYKSYGPLHQKISRWFDADKNGRLVVLPCKPGDELTRNGLTFKADHWNVLLTAFAYDAESSYGKRVKLFCQQEAEAALKKREEADNEAD